ncbi:transposase IS66 family protein [Escherichia coli 3-267-03_S4_C2]|nr:transposase IS66 family protein [Escherichia coli 3-267-03_S4_C2]KDX84283.1 transposase IS66 family protein [Escherichia coli 2-222-05_S4_C2]KEO06056.1 transposase IS66 family protein [Escherichia coli 2-222-05_S4_C3]
MLTGKYCEPLPLYRQSEIFARQGAVPYSPTGLMRAAS